MRLADRPIPWTLLLLLAVFPLVPPAAAQEPAPVTPAAPQVAPAETPVAAPWLRDELLALREEDQAARMEWIKNRADTALQEKVKAIDERTTKRVIEIIDRHGWPGKALVGLDASAAAWILIQHSTPEVIDRYLPLMKEAAEKGDLSKALVALTVDRQLVYHGKPQIYGSQFKAENGQWVPETLEDPANVDQRRAEVGLGPLEEYARNLRQAYGPPPPSETPKEAPKETPEPEDGSKPPHG
ncbi:MAG TPA: DUF6624 domain-containing protein [Thermoanaerobaculia bacterium]|nr:DUF6624 domain-containing protein [Thermoanaerobaculia bacterium]